MVKLVYTLVLGTSASACGFESHYPYHIETQVLIQYLRFILFCERPCAARFCRLLCFVQSVIVFLRRSPLKPKVQLQYDFGFTMTLFLFKSVITAWESVIVKKALQHPILGCCSAFYKCRYAILDFFKIDNLSNITNL